MKSSEQALFSERWMAVTDLMVFMRSQSFRVSGNVADVALAGLMNTPANTG